MFHPDYSNTLKIVSSSPSVSSSDLNLSIPDDSIYDYTCRVLPNRVKMPLSRFSYKVIGRDNTSYCRRVLIK